MSRKKLVHTVPGVELLRKLAAEGDRLFTTERTREFAPAAGLSEGYLCQALHHLARSGWVVRYNDFLL
jgi:predicted transcriptional regulator of viral defense system